MTDDLISRHDAIEAISKDIMGGLNYESILKKIPKVEAEPVRHGRWEDCTNHESVDYEDKCSVCGYTMFADILHRFRYCPWCGAKMDEEK